MFRHVKRHTQSPRILENIANALAVLSRLLYPAPWSKKVSLPCALKITLAKQLVLFAFPTAQHKVQLYANAVVVLQVREARLRTVATSTPNVQVLAQ